VLWPPDVLRRLQAIKARVDPADLFLAAHPVAADPERRP